MATVSLLSLLTENSDRIQESFGDTSGLLTASDCISEMREIPHKLCKFLCIFLLRLSHMLSGSRLTHRLTRGKPGINLMQS